ncbi:MAG: DUF1508 domain-containing protein [Bacteroidia bacterium]|nr:DUF1508 domain-containing protein [Bacteroidia bacterium]
MQFSLIPQAEGKFLFQVQNEAGEAILDSPVFQNRENCVASIRGFVDQIRDPDAINLQEENGRFYFELKDEAGELWMKSLEFDSENDLSEKIQRLRTQANDNTSFEVNMRRQRTNRRMPSLPKEINFAELYDFSLLARSKKLGFHTLKSKKNNKHYFLFNNEQGTPILYSRSFNTETQRDKRIRAIIKQSRNPRKYEIIADAGGSYFILKGSNGKEIARSGTFPDEASAQTAVSFIQEKAPSFEKKYPEPPKAPKKAVNQYILDQKGGSTKVGFDAFKGAEGLHYFHFNNEEGEALLFSEGYSSTRSRDNGIKSLIRNAGLANRFEKREADGKPYFIIRAGNRQEIGRSKFFDSALDIDAIIAWLRIQIPRYAAEYGVSLNTDNLDESFKIEVGRESEENELPPVIIPPGGDGIGILDGSADKSDVHTHVPDHIDLKDEPEPEAEEEEKADKSDSGFSWSKILPWLLVAALIMLLIWLARSCGEEAAVSPVKEDPNNRPVISSTEGAESSTSSASSSEDGMIEGEEEKEESIANKSEGDEILRKEGVGETSDESSESEGKEETEDLRASSDAGAATGLGKFGFPTNSILAKMEAFLAGGASGKSPVYIMDHARFPYNSPKLNKEAEAELDDLTKLLGAYPGAKLEIYGHIDLNENDYYSGPFAEDFLTLSDIRARCIYRKLIERGVPEERLSFDGFANNNPLKKENDPINRRLELVLIK